MASTAVLSADISKIFSATWNRRDGQVVPETEDIALRNGAVELDAVVLYADLVGSTRLAREIRDSTAAKVVRAYLSSMTRLITAHGGHVRSFDGDRVMGVFVEGNKNTSAAKCALKMNYVVSEILRPTAEAKFPSLVTKGFTIAHCAGVARSDVLVVRGGVRGTNDLVFVGSAPNIAAKLSDIRNSPWNTYITWNVHKYLRDEARYGPNGETMWKQVERTIGDEKWDCYKSNWWWAP